VLLVALVDDWLRVLGGVLARYQQELVFELLAIVAKVVRVVVGIVVLDCDAQWLVAFGENLGLIE
jgi:hypothetical protein